MSIKAYIASHKLIIFIIVGLVFSNLYTLSMWYDEKLDRFYYDYGVPHLELTSAMGFYGVDMYGGKILTSSNPGDIAIGEITGFIKFEDTQDQPRGARQYYTIRASDNYDKDGSQMFILTDTIKLNSIPPRSVGDETLRVISNTEQFVTLENESGATFRINKRNDEVVITDADGDTSTLITSQSEYQDFIFDFLGM